MIYRNPRAARPQPEQAARGEHQELLQLLFAVSLIIVVAVLAIDRLTVWLAPKLPFAMEVRLAESLNLDTVATSMLGGQAKRSDQKRPIELALQQRAARIMAVLQVPADTPIRVHYLPSDTVNAMATLGGHLLVFEGLLAKLRYQEELDAVLAHEIGHILHRHMIQHLSRGVMMATALGLIGIRSSSLNQWLIGDLQQLQLLAYSREAEREADDTAILASQRLYGHTAGVVSIFQLFNQLNAGSAPAWTQSHPLPADRAHHAHALTVGTGKLPTLTPLTPPLALAKPDPHQRPER
jgi:predicted Zn-dependent protease